MGTVTVTRGCTFKNTDTINGIGTAKTLEAAHSNGVQLHLLLLACNDTTLNLRLGQCPTRLYRSGTIYFGRDEHDTQVWTTLGRLKVHTALNMRTAPFVWEGMNLLTCTQVWTTFGRLKSRQHLAGIHVSVDYIWARTGVDDYMQGH